MKGPFARQFRFQLSRHRRQIVAFVSHRLRLGLFSLLARFFKQRFIQLLRPFGRIRQNHNLIS